MSARKLISWQPVLTDHQAFTYEALASQAGTQMIAYVSEREDATRKSQGWTSTQVKSIKQFVIPRYGARRYCYRQMRLHRNDTHFFGGAFGNITMIACLLMAVRLDVEFYLVSEPYSPVAYDYLSDRNGLAARIKTWFRPILYRTYCLALGRKVRGVFAISRLALRQFHAAGIAREKLFPFGYFVPRLDFADPCPRDFARPGALRVAFVGSMIATKGIDLLIEATYAARAKGGKVTLDVFGPGNTGTLSFDGVIVRYCGRIPFGKTQTVLREYDLLVLPSRYDGWGVVVNEALCAGIPVLCSDEVGASVVVEHFGAGATFKSGSAHDLSELLLALSVDRRRLRLMSSVAPLAGDSLQPSVAASYILEVLNAPEERRADIVSPWYPTNQW